MRQINAGLAGWDPCDKRKKACQGKKENGKKGGGPENGAGKPLNPNQKTLTGRTCSKVEKVLSSSLGGPPARNLGGF